jgi:hypothetical protein
MKTLTTRVALAALTLMTLSFASCDDDDDTVVTPVTPTQAETVTSLAPGAPNPIGLAPSVVTSLVPQPSGTSSTGAPVAARHYTFYSLETKAEVPYTDSASTKWDVAFKGTTILVNGGTSGPGQGQAQVVTGTTYEAQTTAPATGYVADGATSATSKAIPTGSDNGWYNYNPTSHVISPIAGRVILLKTASGKYAKLEIQNYYQGAPANPTGLEPAGYYTFRHSVQFDGSTRLSTTTYSAAQPLAPAHYTFYSLVTKGTVPYTDSATTKWDLAFRGTTVLVNGGSSGPGQGQAQVLSGLFAELLTGPTTGYSSDAATAKAIPTGSGNGWYSYDATTHVIAPIAGKIIALKTAEGRYAKVEIQNYYKSAPATPNALTDASGYYSFRYVYQADGSTNLK